MDYRLHRQFETFFPMLCKKHGITCTPLSHHWMYALKKGNVQKVVFGYDLGLNSSSTHHVCKDKYGTYEFLHYHAMSVVDHTLFLPPEFRVAGNELEEMRKCTFPLVVKKNDGTGGNDVHKVDSYEELLPIVEKYFAANTAVCLCPFLDISHEYRVIVLNGTVELAFEKARGQDWRHNLKFGGKSLDIHPNILSKLSPLALKVSNVLNLKFGAVDIIEVKGEYTVLEVNSSIMLEHFIAENEENKKKAIEVYEKALQVLFS